ncbi:hypothetical protein PoMZ_04301, partial [Pyricularia oryzae]
TSARVYGNRPSSFSGQIIDRCPHLLNSNGSKPPRAFKIGTTKDWLPPIQHKIQYTSRDLPRLPLPNRDGVAYRVRGVCQNISAGQERRRCDEPGDGQASHIFQRDASPVDGS